MKSLFNQADNKEIIDRISKLTSDSKPEWGKMNIGQMVAHLQVPMRVAAGEIKLKRDFLGILFGSIAKKQVLNNKPFKKNLPTYKLFKMTDDKNFEAEKDKLVKLVRQFAHAGPDGITKEPHPFFGDLTVEQWDNIMWRHLDHHLKQFGV